jgi:hypothetical protein
MRAFELLQDGTRRVIETDRALEAADAGVVVLLEGGLKEVGQLDVLTALFADEVPAPPVALERLHNVLDPDEVAALLSRLDARATPLAIPLSRAIVSLTTPTKRPAYFICSRMWVRAQVPYRLLEERPHLLAADHLVGHLVPVTPHRDSSLTHPRGTVSIWGAVGPVREGNTVALFDLADADGEGPALTPALSPGDVLLFSADRPHASVRNVTDETRVAITTRVVPGRHLRYGAGTHWRPFYDARLLDTPFEPLATLQSRMTLAALRRWRWRRTWAKEQRRAKVGAAQP